MNLKYALFLLPLIVESAPIYDQYTAQAKSMVEQMTLTEKIGQMVLPTLQGVSKAYAPGGLEGAQNAWQAAGYPPTPSLELGDAMGFYAIKSLNLAAVLIDANFPYAEPLPKNLRLPQWQALAATAQLYQTQGLPLFLGTDAIHGNQHVVGTILFPHNIGLGATHNPALIGLVGAWSAYDIATSGFNWAYAPTVAIAHDYRWGRTYESFSSNSDVVLTLSQYYIAGLQGITNPDTGQVRGVIGCSKHFIADGNTKTGVDKRGTSYALDTASVWSTNGAGYEGAVALDGPIAQVGSGMAAFSNLNGIPMHFGGDFNLLNRFRNEGITIGNKTYKLSGFVVSDYDGVVEAASTYNPLHNTCLTLPQMMAMGINAGVDMVMLAVTSPPYYSNAGDVIASITEAVNCGLISTARIDDAVTRILRTKLSTSFAIPPVPPVPEATVSLDAAQQSLVLLKNSNVIPINPLNMQYVFLLGSYDDIGVQNGGWTVSWQGQEGNYYWTGVDRITSNATSVLDGVSATIPGAQLILGEQNALDHNLSGINASNSVALIMINEYPYAEYMGDVQNQNPLYYFGVKGKFNRYVPANQNCFLGMNFTDQQARAVKRLRKAGIPVITVLFSGRPLVITEGCNAPLPLSDAFIAAFLPGTSGGQALANVIFGNFITKSVVNTINGKTYYSNTLPFAWPASMKEVVQTKPTLFPEGFGL